MTTISPALQHILNHMSDEAQMTALVNLTTQLTHLEHEEAMLREDADIMAFMYASAMVEEPPKSYARDYLDTFRTLVTRARDAYRKQNEVKEQIANIMRSALRDDA
jgi:hypothetical protein